MIKAGTLRHQVTIQRLVAGSPQQKPSGEPDTAWAAWLTNVSASIEPLRGRELFAAQEHHSEVTTRIRVRYRAGVEPTMRVVFGSTVYEVLAVLDKEMRHVELELLCRVGVNDG